MRTLFYLLGFVGRDVHGLGRVGLRDFFGPIQVRFELCLSCSKLRRDKKCVWVVPN